MHSESELNLMAAVTALAEAGRALDMAGAKWRANPVPLMWAGVEAAGAAYVVAAGAQADALALCLERA